MSTSLRKYSYSFIYTVLIHFLAKLICTYVAQHISQRKESTEHIQYHRSQNIDQRAYNKEHRTRINNKEQNTQIPKHRAQRKELSAHIIVKRYKKKWKTVEERG